MQALESYQIKNSNDDNGNEDDDESDDQEKLDFFSHGTWLGGS